LCLFGGNATADDNWSYNPSISQNFSYDSNPLLLSGEHQAVYGSVTAPKLTIMDSTPTTQLIAGLTLDENLFNLSSFDSTDAHTNISLDEKLEQWEVGFTQATDYDTTRTSEISTFNQNTEGSIRHLGNSISPEISFSPSELDKISLTGSATDSHYDSSIYTDYHTLSLTPSYQYNFTPSDIGSISVQTQRYQTDSNISSKVDSVAPYVGWTKILTPTLTAKATVGLEEYHEQIQDVADNSWKLQTIYSAEIDYKGELDTLALSGTRALQPYENGTEYFLNTISLSDNHTLNTLFSGNIAASYQFASNNDQASTNLKSYVNATAGIAYHVTDKFDITSSYQYRDQELTNVPGSQSDNVFLLGLVYRPKLDNAL
jgi:hypothetical protein